MTGWKMKRFWNSAEAVESADGFGIHLDGRIVRTPAKAVLMLPTAAMAEAIAEEWNAQGEDIDPNLMPVTKYANAATDTVATRFPEIAAMLGGYADTDLTCYRAPEPEDLVIRQGLAWDPLLDWMFERFGIRLKPFEGLVHHPQSDESLESLRAPLDAMTPFELTAMCDLVGLSGSLVIGIAVSDGYGSPEAHWKASRIDEDWQMEQWGEDAEAMESTSRKRRTFLDAAGFLKLARA